MSWSNIRPTFICEWSLDQNYNISIPGNPVEISFVNPIITAQCPALWFVKRLIWSITTLISQITVLRLCRYQIRWYYIEIALQRWTSYICHSMHIWEMAMTISWIPLVYCDRQNIAKIYLWYSQSYAAPHVLSLLNFCIIMVMNAVKFVKNLNWKQMSTFCFLSI